MLVAFVIQGVRWLTTVFLFAKRGPFEFWPEVLQCIFTSSKTVWVNEFMWTWCFWHVSLGI